MVQFRRLLQSFARDDRGVFGVVFGLMAVVLVALGGAVIDYVTLQQARTRSQTALDAATLALQPSINDATETDETIRQKAEALVLERLGTNSIRNAKIDKVVIDRDKGELLLSGTFSVETIFVKLIGVEELHASITSQATKGVANVEVAVALDVTGSMSEILPSGDTRLAALQKAVLALNKEILALNTSENYAKVALVPYAQAINAGQYATALRGPIQAEAVVMSATWADGSRKAITSVSKASPAVLRSNNHGLSSDQYVFVMGTNVSTINNRVFQVKRLSADEVSLVGLNTTNVIGNITGGTATKCLYDNCALLLTAPGHKFASGEDVEILGSAGLTFDGVSTVRNVTRDTFLLTPSTSTRAGTYTPQSARAHCLWQSPTMGCTRYRFTNAARGTSIHALTTCITERSPNGATDNPPTVTLMGRNYPNSNNACTTGEILPLTRSEADLTRTVNALTSNGSTSGSLGILGAWQMLAPKFGYVWPQGSQPAPYLERYLMKAAVIMTDGEFNTVHCNGVVSNISTNGSFVWQNRQDQINCAAPNGSPYAQAELYCNAMKRGTGIIVFTVGLGITEGSAAAAALRNCASGQDKYFLADNTANLVETFREIAQKISALRLTR